MLFIFGYGSSGPYWQALSVVSRSIEPDSFNDVDQFIIREIVLIIDRLELFLEMIDCGIDDLLPIGSIWVEALGVNWSSFNHRRSMITVRVIGKP
jgi:hypothetical protein